MKLIIDIPEYNFERIREYYDALPEGSVVYAETYYIANGTPLPKGHGRIVDADELTKEIKGYISDTSNLHYDDLEEAEAFNSAYYNCLDEIEDAPTIIEADKGE